MLKPLLFSAPLVAAALIWATSAHALPGDTVDRAIACSVYGGFAPNSDPMTVPAKREIDQIIREAIASGQRTQQQVSDAFNDAAQLAMNEEPREELIANWRECRESFGPRDLRS
jgi:hypothetical protein